MIYLFSILSALLIYLSYKSFRGGVEYLRYFRQELSKTEANYFPFASVFVPCRGVDQGMLENFDALLSQDYPDYEVVFIVDDESDEAKDLIEAAWREARRQVKLVVASHATESSQKVENLREGVEYADPDAKVFVFADSDARPSKAWLKSLIAPLSDEGVGAATGYRWFISERPTFASEIRNMWNASIASALGPNRKTNFCWGGATAITREVFERLAIRETWAGTVSDDFIVTRTVKEAGLEIHFVPAALTPSVEDCTIPELLEFTTRQMKITRVYARNLWVLSFFGSGLFTGVMLTAMLVMAFRSRNDATVVAAMFALVAVTAFSIGKSWMRLRAVELALPGYANDLRRQFIPQVTLWTLTPPLFLYNCIAALISNEITWRGTTYRMISRTKTRISRTAGKR